MLHIGMFLRVISQNQDNLDATRVLIERIQHSSLNKLWRAHPFPFDVRKMCIRDRGKAEKRRVDGIHEGMLAHAGYQRMGVGLWLAVDSGGK